jgi:hypothetical protein
MLFQEGRSKPRMFPFCFLMGQTHINETLSAKGVGAWLVRPQAQRARTLKR